MPCVLAGEGADVTSDYPRLLAQGPGSVGSGLKYEFRFSSVCCVFYPLTTPGSSRTSRP